jgi:cysteine synthase
VLKARTTFETIPQIFVGGEFVGGCTEAFDAYRSGRLQTLLDAHGVAWDRGVAFDPYALLPAWLQPRS